jgi:hypothetical protein
MKGSVATVVPRLVAPRGGRAHEIEMFSHYVGTYVRSAETFLHPIE